MLHERASEYYASGAGWLSLKTFTGGRAIYTAGGGTFAVDDTCYLLLNHATPYSVTIESPRIVESCCFFWEPAATARAYRALTAPDDVLLTEPTAGTLAPVLVERTFRTGDELSGMADRLRAASNSFRPEPARLEEQLLDMLSALLRVNGQVALEIASLPHGRASTRTELYRRLYLAREYAEASFERPVRLAELADVAGMSPNHLLRSFRQLFGCTPLQYLTARRIQLARRLLSDSELPISEVCLAIGFESFGSFSRIFRRYAGCSPSEYRSTNQPE